MNIAHIVGNRPQFIKLALVLRALARHPAVRSRIIHTGQHSGDLMSDVFFRELEIPAPDHTLGIHSLPHNVMIGHMLIALDPILSAHRPDAVIVYGDTNSTLAGALAAKKRQIQLLHVEAGIRTGQEEMQEESNRYLTDRLADLNFTCTRLGETNLLREGLPADRIQNTGDLMLDAALLFAHQAARDSTLPAFLFPDGRPFVLSTIHRAENIDNPAALNAILQAFHSIHQQIPVLMPLHPRTRHVIETNHLPFSLLDTPPVGYLDMLALLQRARFVITDSGGLSREAFFFQKPAVIIMKQLFWPEVLEYGPNLTATADTKTILDRFQTLAMLNKPFQQGVFGDGHAAEKIAGHILNQLHA